MVTVSSFLPELELPQAVMEPASIVRAHRQAVAFPKVFRFRFIFSFLIRTTPFHHPFQKEKRRLHVWFSRRPCQLKSEFFPFLQNAQRIFLERNLFFSVWVLPFTAIILSRLRWKSVDCFFRQISSFSQHFGIAVDTRDCFIQSLRACVHRKYMRIFEQIFLQTRQKFAGILSYGKNF